MPLHSAQLAHQVQLPITVEVEQRWPALVHPAYEAFRVTWSCPERFFFLIGQQDVYRLA